MRFKRFLVWLLLVLLPACASPLEPLPGGPQTGLLFEPDGEAQGIIVAIHGFNDHSVAFEEFGPFAAARGFVVDAYDQQGFGRNPNWGSWPGEEVLVRDLRERLRQHRRTRPHLPLFVLGESMGAAVALVALADAGSSLADGLVLVSPAIWGGEAMNPVYRMVLWVAERTVPNFTFSGRRLGVQASDNIDALRALGRDPLFIKETRVAATAGVVRLMGQAREAGRQLELPRLLLAGAKDRVVPPQAFTSWLPSLLAESCRFIVYEDGWHYLLRDLQRERVWLDIISWLRDSLRDGGTRSGPLGHPDDAPVGQRCDG